ncbi:MAG: tyrosine recombinase XerC [Planctomycetota bacterium]|nr:tyrosine recombinase XerC [Planctomycetota bacterium]
MRIAIDRFLRYLDVERNSSDLTIKCYREDLDMLCYFLEFEDGTLPTPGDVSPQDLRQFVSAMTESGYARSSISRRLATLRSFYRFCQREGYTQENPAKPLRNPRKQRSLPHFLTTKEVGQLIAAPDISTVMGTRDHAVMETMYSAGLRVGELVGINQSDLHLDEGLVRVRGKGRKERFAPLGSFAVHALENWLKRRTLSNDLQPGPESPIFVNRFGRRISTRSIGRMLEKYIKQTGLDARTSPHTLRHSFATHLLDRGAEIRSVQELLGHKSLVTTQIYTHLTTTHLKDVYEKAHPLAAH